ncbi:hypothetical protein TBR22_A07030 [Luteitalea sp. TBR-22]|uniref:cyclic nucleotide-binding domain-containing protein n=1 Tax=Luteitalea sp. TBR-22 TaxID=2802971 RepID=UPI001AFC6B33|nr:cyclic nucleotide-binding domain-containing protein [Luteitalea sp. TBR-22]BCS31502.1 hypothetical protein TBR22_A07030 [Luteitalea sp. TBR-22]
MTHADIVTALGSSALFADLPPETLASVAARATVRRFEPGDVIVCQGAPSDAVYLLVNGIVAVKRVIGRHEALTLGYLMTGATFGEVGILEDRPRSANVEAVSTVDALAFHRADFLELLLAWPAAAIALARLLGGYLVDANRRLTREGRQARCVLVCHAPDEGGAMALALALARRLRLATGTRTAYTAFNDRTGMAAALQLPATEGNHAHPDGFEVLAATPDTTSLQTASLAIEQLVSIYDNLVITNAMDLARPPDPQAVLLLDEATDVLLLVPRDADAMRAARAAAGTLRRYLRPDATVLTVVSGGAASGETLADGNDVEIPSVDDEAALGEWLRSGGDVPAALHDAVDRISNRLERNNRIALFIPTTVDVDARADTTAHVQRALDFLAKRFGGATSREATGVWNSHVAGLVAEQVFIVNTFVSRAALHRHLDEVVAFVKVLKGELRQEAMALEVNDTLTLI